MSPAADEGQPVQLGNGVVLPRPTLDQIMALEDDKAVIDRMLERASNRNDFGGVPHRIAQILRRGR